MWKLRIQENQISYGLETSDDSMNLIEKKTLRLWLTFLLNLEFPEPCYSKKTQYIWTVFVIQGFGVSV